MKARRKALNAAVAKRLVPHLVALGFESTRKKTTKDHWAELNRWEFGYGRRRGDRVDFVSICWDKYNRPWFFIDFATCTAAEIAFTPIPESWRSGILRPARYAFGIGGQWFGQLRSSEVAVDLAIQRLAELDVFLESGRQSQHVDVLQAGGGAFVSHTLPVWEKVVLRSIWLVALPFRLLWVIAEFLEGRRKLGR